MEVTNPVLARKIGFHTVFLLGCELTRNPDVVHRDFYAFVKVKRKGYMTEVPMESAPEGREGAMPLDIAIIEKLEELHILTDEATEAALNNPMPAHETDEDFHTHLLAYKLNTAQHELQMHLDSRPEGLPHDPEVFYVYAKNQQKEFIDESRKIIYHLQVQKNHVKSQHQHLADIIRREHHMRKALDAEIERRQTELNGQNEMEQMLEVRAQQKTINQKFKLLKTGMHEFIREVFPEKAEYISLFSIISSLSNASSCPEGRATGKYVAVTEDMWQPHIELLLRSGIAKHKPRDPSLICLEDFD